MTLHCHIPKQNYDDPPMKINCKLWNQAKEKTSIMKNHIMYHPWKSTGVMSPADKVKEWKSILGARITIFALYQQKRLSYCPIKTKKKNSQNQTPKRSFSSKNRFLDHKYESNAKIPKTHNKKAYLRQIILSWLYLRAKAIKEGSMIPPRSLSTRCRVDSE